MNKTITTMCLMMAIAIQSYAQKPLGVPGNWTLQSDFSDEFDAGLNTSKWEHNPNDWGPWSWEPNRTKVNNGKLKLTMDWEKHTRGNTQLYFTSGIIRSKKDIKYGYFEVKMKGAARHPGVCPAFWTYSIGQPVINGVKYNEIDFPEIQQRQRNVNTIDWNVIRADANGKRTSVRYTTGTGTGPSFDPRDEYHVYGCNWTADVIEFFIDGVKVASHPNVYQFHKQHLVISMGLREPFYEYVNGNRVAIPTNSRPSGFPTTMQVEYVRVWKGTASGGGGGGNSCSAPAWKSGSTYKLKDEVSHKNKIWRWKSRTNGNCTPGDCGRWKDMGACGSSSRLLADGEIEEEITTSNIRVFPNPTSNQLNFTLNLLDGPTNYRLTDIQGRVVLQGTSSETSNSLDVSGLKKGIYLIRIENGADVHSSKVVLR
ncbi:family 16 glycosylhydrolase [Reichenbachiella carrageenanivorans]|uniref:Family 16 glycosylhydrolase n=1 Tax=Reichenbachiella carrageenanivorans TaxID=2979869 RepID=A0ABY6D0E9_9BACT|nr:family 16 glycosylhydrolase [Reichenbachiella carrageenanivorans]UXX79389.1 family 16 glycosylhydrolase [Reichenbachiella carrageenanivorans]